MRKTKEVQITEGRDQGKTFVLTEMSAMRTEKWAWKAFMAIGKSGVFIPDDLANQGMVGIAIVGLQALMRADFADVEPLMTELWACTQIKEPAGARPVTEDDVEDAETVLKLRREALSLHWEFLSSVAQSTFQPSPVTDAPKTPQ